MYRIEERIIGVFLDVFRKIRGRNVLVSIPYAWVLLFFIFPCLILLKISFADSVLASPPYTSVLEWISGNILQLRLNLGNYTILFTDEMYIRGFITSILIAGTSTLCCLIIGFPMAYAIVRSSKNIRNILLMLVVLPFWTSFLIRIYAWIMLLSPSGFINTFLIKFGIIEIPLQLMNNSYAACIGIIYAYLPFMIFPLYSAIEKIDFSLIEAAYDLGSTPMKSFFSIVIPLAMPGVYAGSMLVFVPAIGEYVIPELLGGAQTLTIGRLVWNEFFGNLSWPTAASLSIVLMMFIVLLLIVLQRREKINALNVEAPKNAS